MKRIDKYDFAVSIGDKAVLSDDGFYNMNSAGVKAVELSFGDYTDIDFKKIKSLSEKYNVGLWSLHLPFMPFEKIDISSTDSDMRKANVEMLCGIVASSAETGINRFVIHASGEPVLPPVRTERMKCSKDSLYKLSEYIKEYNGVLAVENLPRTCLGNCSKEINELTAVNDNLLVCFDTNHLSEETARDFVKNLNKKIETVHISDYDFVGEKHWLPGCGKVDWKEIIELLDNKDYTGPILYEVSFKKGNYPSGKEVTFVDLSDNYNHFFNNRM